MLHSSLSLTGGRHLARADSYEDRIWVRATHTGAGQISSYGFQGAQALVDYIIQPGDRLYWRQWQSSTARGGLVIQFTQAPHASWGTYDQDGQQINSDNVTNQWHYRRVDLTPFAGKTINWMWITADSQTLPGYYDMTFQDIALVSADGAVRRVFSRDKTIALTPFASSGVTGQAYSISHAAGVGWYPPVTTTYYHGDHLGSSRQMTNADGYPVWEATYLPYGQERAVAGGSSASVNHYKFTGKERDPESGLDYFGARYYSSGIGRFLTPDWAAAPTAVPYADFGDPQSLNLYTYVGNNPITRFDVDGHCWPVSECVTQFQNAVNAAANKVFTASIERGDVTTAIVVDALRGSLNDASDKFRAGDAVGACIDSCTGIQMADAASKDLQRTAGLVNAAASLVVTEKIVGSTGEQATSTSQGDAQGSTDQGQLGSIYVVPGGGTQSGKPYVGRHNQPDPAKTRRSSDGRDRRTAQVVDTYDASNTQQGRQKEQQQLDQRGLENLDNKRNEIRKPKKSQ